MVLTEQVYVEGEGFQGEVLDVTPTMARRYLGENFHNRSLMNSYVDRLAGSMERGEWVFNGDSIKFDEQGNLLDGQHRLHAIVKSGKTIKMLVLTGLKKEAQETMDIGRSRKLSDMLKLRGVSWPVLVSSAVGVLWKYQNGLMKRQGGTPTPQQGLALYESHPDISDGIRWADRAAKHLRLNPSAGTVASYILHRVNWEDAEDFLTKLESGIGLNGPNDPIYVYREWLIRQSQLPPYERADRIYQLALMFKAWNLYREGKEATVLVWAPGGKRNEAFPTPK